MSGQNSSEDIITTKPTITTNTDSLTTSGGGDERLVLIDSGANALYTEKDSNLTNIRPGNVQIIGINGVSIAKGVGTLPPMVTNTGQVLYLKGECVISKPGDRRTTQARTIITPKHLNEAGVSILFAHGTTVLLQADTVQVLGKVVHEENFIGGMAYIRVKDTTNQDISSTSLPQGLTDISPGVRRAKLKPKVMKVHLADPLAQVQRTSTNTLLLEVRAAESTFKLNKNSRKRSQAILKSFNLRAMKVVETSLRSTKRDSLLTSENSALNPCLAKQQLHSRYHGTAFHDRTNHKAKAEFDSHFMDENLDAEINMLQGNNLPSNPGHVSGGGKQPKSKTRRMRL